MTEKELKRLRRVELLEMLVEISKENERIEILLEEQEKEHQEKLESVTGELQTKIDELQAQLEDKKLVIGKVGSIAEASLQLNGVFAAAEAAAEQYLKNIRNQAEVCKQIERAAAESAAKRLAEAEAEAQDLLHEAEEKAARMVSEAEEKAARMVSEAEEKSSRYWTTVSERLEAFYNEHRGLKELMNIAGGDGNDEKA